MVSKVFTIYEGRSYNSHTKYNLKNMYFSCRAFWADEGDSKTCTVSMVANEEYQYVQSRDVVIFGSGVRNKFCAIAWHLGNNQVFKMDSVGTSSGLSDFFIDENILTIDPLNKIWIYEKLTARHLFYYSIFLILSFATIALTAWSGGYPILSRQRKFSVLIVLETTFNWLFIALLMIGFLIDRHIFWELLGPLLGIPVIYSISLAFSLIRWGRQIESGKELPDYLTNHSAEKLKKSGAYLLGVMVILLALNYMYSNSYLNYQNRAVKFSKEMESSIKTDPSSFQKMCQQPFS